MKPTQQKAALASAVAAAKAVGQLMLANRRSPKKINLATQHDIKLELDVRSQKRIERMLRRDLIASRTSIIASLVYSSQAPSPMRATNRQPPRLSIE